jgi:hypothetical protein
MSLNGGAISWRSSRQGGVTLSSSEAELVAARQAGQEVVYLRVLLRGFGYTQKKPMLLRGFGYTQKKPTEIWEDNA